MLPARLPRIDFAPEWCGVVLLAVLDAVWAARIQFHLILAWHDAMLLATALSVTLALRVFGQKGLWQQGGVIGEYFSLTLVATSVFGVMSYLALASSGHLVDPVLLAADRAMRFDWLAGYHFLQTHPVPARILQLAYNSLVYQGLYFCVLLGVMDRRRHLREMFWLVFVMGLFTSTGAVLFPALGPFQTLHAAPDHSFLPEMLHLKSGQNLTFALSNMTGVVSFPSFHTAMALAYAWGFRRTGAIGWVMAALNLSMLCAIPYFGGHYLIDMIAGAGVFVLSLAAVKAVERLRASAGYASPESAAASAGAY